MSNWTPNKTNPNGGAGAGGAAAAAAGKTTAPIAIGGKAGASKDDGGAPAAKKQVPVMAYSMPTLSRPAPPKAPTQRPRVPSVEPPLMELPPSPAADVPIMNMSGSADPLASAPVNVVGKKGDDNDKKKKPQVLSRSLTIYSSSAPNVSFMQNMQAFLPAFAPLAEGRPVDEPAAAAAATAAAGQPAVAGAAAGAGAGQPNSATSINSTTSSGNSTAASSPTPLVPPNAAALGAGPRRKSGLAKEDELLAAVGSPTVFSMLRLDADIRRKNSITDGKLPVLGTSLGTSLKKSPAAQLLADGKKGLRESKTQKEIDAQKAAAAAKAAAGAAGTANVAKPAEAQGDGDDDDSKDTAGTEPDDLQFDMNLRDEDGGEDAAAGGGGDDAFS